MCKHQSGGMSKPSTSTDSGANNVSRNFVVPSTNNCTLDHQGENPNSNNCLDDNCSKFYLHKMAIGPQCMLPSNKECESENDDVNHSRKESNGEKLDENGNGSERMPVFQNEKRPSNSTSCQINELSLPPSVEVRLPRRNSVPGVHNSASYCPMKNADCGLDSDLNSVTNFPNLQDDIQPGSSFSAYYVGSTPNSSDSIVSVNNDDNISHCSYSQHCSMQQNWFLPKQTISDEVFSQKSCIPVKTLSIHNFLMQKNMDNELLIKNSNTDLPLKTASVDFSPDAIVLQRRGSAHWEVSSVRDYYTGLHCKSFSVSPAANFSVLETASLNDTEASYPTSCFQKRSYLPSERRLTDASVHPTMFSRSSITRQSFASSFSDGSPICKICHFVGREGDPLISPCRCSGTVQFIHCGCLMKWLEISSKRSRKPPICELCHYQYQWHKKFKVRHWQFPNCSRKDITLHVLFLLSILVMIACATITILCFKQDKGTKIDPDSTELTNSEITTLICGVLFFLAFFLEWLFLSRFGKKIGELHCKKLNSHQRLY